MEWINPHAWMHIDVKDDDSKVTSWMIEAGTPNTLFRGGFTKDSLKIGTEVLVDGHQAKDGSNTAHGRDVTLTDGQSCLLGLRAPAPPRTRSISSRASASGFAHTKEWRSVGKSSRISWSSRWRSMRCSAGPDPLVPCALH